MIMLLMNTKSNEVDKLAKIIWDYHLMHHRLKKVDLILALGSSDIQVAERAAELYMQNWSHLIVISGGYGRNTKKMWGKTEAEVFLDIIVSKGVPRDNVILEKESSNTGENVINTKMILREKGINPKKIIAVQKPFMERRTYSTIKNYWPDLEIYVTSPKIVFEKYKIAGRNKNQLVNDMVGDLQRIREYPKMGFQITQRIPRSVWDAYKKLIKLGYTNNLIKAD